MRRSRYKKATLKIEDLFWLAGLLEGEGCFTLSKCGRRKWPRISIQMIDEDVIQKTSKLFNRSYWKTSPPSKAGNKPLYKTHITGRPALHLMGCLFPLLSVRRQNKIKEIKDKFASVV